MNAFERFWSMVDIRDQRDCWEWTGTRDQCGYGIPDAGLQIAFREPTAHRIACALFRIRPAGANEVLHSCDNSACCNPRHLRWGTHEGNMEDLSIASWARASLLCRNEGQSVPSQQPNGRAWAVIEADAQEPTTFRRGLPRLNHRLVRAIRADHAAGMSARDIGIKYGITQSHADSVAKGRIWRSVA